MPHQNDLGLDGGWIRPIPERQTDLFPRTLDETLKIAGLTREELRTWKQKGWLSFDDSQGEHLDSPHFCEMIFIRNPVWDLRDDSLVDKFLKGLNGPYRYDPVRTAFSFAHGWVQTPDAPDAEAADIEKCNYIENYMEWWIQYKSDRADAKTLEWFGRRMFQAGRRISGRKKS